MENQFKLVNACSISAASAVDYCSAIQRYGPCTMTALLCLSPPRNIAWCFAYLEPLSE